MEDAGEEILRGEPYRECVYCEGSGINSLAETLCSGCNGAGKHLRDEYKAACEMLKIYDKPIYYLAQLLVGAQQNEQSLTRRKSLQQLKAREEQEKREHQRRQRQLDEQWEELRATGIIKNKRL